MGQFDLGWPLRPGTDRLTLRALRRTDELADDFPQSVFRLWTFLAPASQDRHIQAVQEAGTKVAL